MSEKNICPGCGRHCDLSQPHCGRGEEYRRTGNMPGRQGAEHHEHHEHHECHEMRAAHYQAAGQNDKLIINLRDLSHIMRSLYEGRASQKRILMILNQSGRITQRDLTEHLGIQPGSASEILSKLENAGLITRTPNEADRRTTDICLTDAGREHAEEALVQRRKRHEEMFSCLSEDEKQELLSLLERVCADWKTRYREGRNPHGHGEHHHCRRDGDECRGEHSRHEGRCREEHSRHEGSHGHGGN